MHHIFRIIVDSDSALRRFADVGALVTFLHDPGDCQAQKTQVLRGLVRAGQTRDDRAQSAQTILLLALWPGLCGVRRRLAPLYSRDGALLSADVTGRCCEIIATLDLDRVSRVAATILMNVERDLRRQRRRDARSLPVAPGDMSGEQSCTQPHSGLAVRCSSLRPLFGSDTALVTAVVLYGMTQKEAARALGITHEAARKRFQRAVARMRAAS
ncbi:MULTISPECIES: sigma-70 family RNA polymerase sigma factor [Mameliella]|uniref:sigma-70 family RNA polymerase sigma factor n=1 Tax=Mameliella TaxID=1434019 RepID=UPI0010568934|nr:MULTISPECIES: sigma-70 family RNA polymerase sigma factor [Mameliella]